MFKSHLPRICSVREYAHCVMPMKKTAFIIALATLYLCACSPQTEEGAAPLPTETVTESAADSLRPVSIPLSNAANPITRGSQNEGILYGGDPCALVSGDTLYLYTGHDISSGNDYVIPEYLCWSTRDMESWQYEGVVMTMADVTWADKNSAWAAQAALHTDPDTGEDMYYLYFCSWDSTDGGKQSIGCAVSHSPTGPFEDIGHPIVKGSLTADETSTWNDIDPTVWIENEGGTEHRYLMWGNSKLYICELNEDMTSLKDLDGDGKITFRQDVLSKMPPDAYTEAPWLYRRRDDKGEYYGDYYLFYANGWREQMAYATCGDPMTERFIYQDVIMKPTATSNTNHPAVVDFLGRTWFIYHNGALPGGSGYRRCPNAVQLEFYSDGAIKPMEESACGAFGTLAVITSAQGEVLSHEWFNNSSSDASYPYTDIRVGSGFDKSSPTDSLWNITRGKSDPDDGYRVSVESENKPGLYITVRDGSVVLSQDHDGKQGAAQTFLTYEAPGGNGFVLSPETAQGKYLAIKDGAAYLTDDADEAVFNITYGESS